MALVYPLTLPCSNSYITSRRETFTVWMKSLVVHGNGCTVFDSNGEIIYRMDNYDQKGGTEVYLMDLRGRVLFSIRRKKLGFFGCRDGYKWSESKIYQESRPWFRVRRSYNIFRRNMSYHVTFGHDRAKENAYKIGGFEGKSTFKIINSRGELVAEVRQKELASGLMLGDDVLSLVVEPQIDHSLIMALVTVFGLMTDKI